MTPARVWAAAVLLSGLAALGDATPVAARQDAQQEQVDSAHLRVLEHLSRLDRAPGYDSILYVQDSVRAAGAELGDRLRASEGFDSVSTVLLAMPGFALTEYEGGAADFRVQDRVIVLHAAEGDRARLASSDGTQLQADTSITFDQSTGLVREVGGFTFTPPVGDPVDGATMVYDVQAGRGSALDAVTSYSQGGARWHVQADMPWAAPDSTFMSHARFTSCDREEPHYHFEAEEVKIVRGNTLVARNVRLYFGDVPVFWLPFIAQSLSPGRASGLLTPRFSINDIVSTSGGYRRRVSNIGFYWAMSDYSDALVAMDWFSETFLSLTSSVRYNFARQFLDGGLNLRRYWREDGSTELALDTDHSWTVDERTELRVSGRFASSNDFVRENSFNPREVTQSIDSEGGINRRFDWGAVSVSANRKQYLSDDRTEWTLPSANLSLSPITIFRAPSTDAHFWNNMTWSGGTNLRRNTVDLIQPDTFSFAQASSVTTSGSVRSNLSIANLTFAQSVNVTEGQTLGVPEALLLLGDSANPADLLTGAPARNIVQARLDWTTSISYQQQLIGSTTLTPRLGMSGNMLRSDTSSVAQSFVSAPARISFGAQLKTDIYGFFPGFGSFEAIRHKLSPSFNYQWSPASSPSDLQQQVFGSRALQPKNALSLTLNQTLEAKREPDADTPEGLAPADSVGLTGPAAPVDLTGEPRRLPQAETVTLLALRTSVVRYDFVEADSAGSFLQGFETTRLSNQISSDILRGLSMSTSHELFDDQLGSDGTIEKRRFDPHLSQVNLSFALGSRSSIFRWLGLFGAGDSEDPVPEEPAETELTDPFAAQGPTDESSVIPSGTRSAEAPAAPARSRSTGGWNANISYSLQRPRDETLPASRMLTGMLRLQPTQNWELSWRTAYDLEAKAFNDHSIRLTRDLHRWRANFDFLQTATGNWSFRFEVSLLDNRDLKFDYKQRNLDAGLPASQR